MTFSVPRRPGRLCAAPYHSTLATISRAGPRAEGWSARAHVTLLAGLLACAACTPTTYSVMRDPPDYVDHVIEDVTAIVEGMARAHAKDRPVYRDPGIRSSLEPGLK